MSPKKQVTTGEGPQLAPVDDYPEKYDDERDEVETMAAERRNLQTDQLPYYHEEWPTLDISGPEHDPEVIAELQRSIFEAEEKEATKLAKRQLKEERAMEAEAEAEG